MEKRNVDGQEKLIVIHVYDEGCQVTKDFICQRELLLMKMKYFRAYLNQANKHDDIDISVHCDIKIFEWLIQYMHEKEYEWKARITIENVASILVSSEFLQMENLLMECIDFITKRMQDFLQLRVDFNCLSDYMITQIAEKCSANQLEILNDPRNKILSKLQQKKTEQLIGFLLQQHKVLHFCKICHVIYLKEHADKLHCHRGLQEIDAYGELVARHQPKENWNITTYVKEHQENWIGTYWFILTCTYWFQCQNCNQVFSFVEYRNCKYHPGEITGIGQHAHYTCCNIHIFDADDRRIAGCTTREHTTTWKNDELHQYTLNSIENLNSLYDKVYKSGLISRPELQDTLNLGDLSSGLTIKSLLGQNENEISKQTDECFVAKSPEKDDTTPRSRQWKIMALQEQDHKRMELITQRVLKMRKHQKK